MLQNSTIQNYIAQAVVSELSNKISSKVSIGKIEYKFFNAVSIHDLYVEDKHQNALLFVNQADAHFDFWKFFQGKILFTSVEFDHLYGNLIVDSTGKTNIDFIIKAFKKPQTNTPSRIEYKIDHLKLISSTFLYSNLRNNKVVPANIFNANRLKFTKINTDISLNIWNKDTLSARINSLSAVEQSGLVLKNLSTQVLGSRKGISLPNFDLELPNSRLHLNNIQLKYDSLIDLKHFSEKVQWRIPITTSYFKLSDLAAFVPEFKNLRGIATLKGQISGKISSLRFKNMEIKYGKHFLLKADVDLNGLPNIEETFIYGQINDLQLEKSDLQDFVSDFTKKPFLLPKELNELGLVRYKGNITGFLSNLVAYGNIKTEMGSVSTDILLKFENRLKDLTYNGTVKSVNFQLGRVLNNKDLGIVSFDFNTKGTKKAKSSYQGTIDAKVPELQFKGYSYRDIQFKGKYDGSGFDGKIDVEDQNIHAHFNGVIDLTHKLPVLDFDLKISDTDLNALKLTDRFPGARLSFNGKTNMLGNSLDNIIGFLKFDSISFTNQGKTINVNEIQFNSRIEKDYRNFVITSDYVNGAFTGDFSYSTIGLTLSHIIQRYLPALSFKKKDTSKNSPNQIDVDLKISNTKDISEVLNLPYTLEGVSTIKGSIDEKNNRIDLSGNFPLLTSGRRKLENISLLLQNSKQQLEFTSRAQLIDNKNGLLNLYLLATAEKDSVRSQLGWQNAEKITNAGEVQSVTKFRKDNGKTAAQISILPSQVIISDTTWNVYPCLVDMNADSTIRVNNFRFESHKQYIHINGIASKSQKDSMTVVMNDLSVGFILNLLQLKGIIIGGNATGRATLHSVLKQPIYEANIFVKAAKINNKLIGDATLKSSWDRLNKQVLASGRFVNEKNEIIADANGVFVPKKDSLDFMFDAHNLNIEFLTPYFETVIQNVKGLGTGKVRMFGPSKNIGFEGNVYVDKGQASMNLLKTTYYFNDTIRLSRKSLELRNIKLYDEERNMGTLNGMLTHNGMFKNMQYHLNVKAKNILAMNTHSEDNSNFFGKAYVDGTVRIDGDQNEANIRVNATTKPHTKCFIQIGSAATASDNAFIQFRNNKLNTRKDSVVPKPAEKKVNVKINLQIEATPDAEMELIIDPKAGDMITAKGNGNLRVQFDSYSDLKLYGTYAIDNGYYLFTLQNVIRKEFKIDRGSSISWTGNPFNAQVDIRAIYSLNASLKDLDEALSQSTNRSSVPVNCVLKLTDKLTKPNINFDIVLPSSDERVKQQVRSIINTDEMMNRQILYLLLFGKFYTPEYVKSSATASNVGTNQAISFFTTTLSAQLNNWFSQMVNSNNFSFGFDWRKTDEVNSEYQAEILYQPNNRWIVNGNIGYRNDNLATNTNKFIGDVDIEYLLTKSGKLRLKGYNHTIDRYQLRTAKTTQGFGFIYREDFTSVGDLFKYYWHLLTGTGKKETNEKNSSKND